MRNLCAHEWIVSNSKGTTDEFSTYYDGLSAEDKQVSSFFGCHDTFDIDKLLQKWEKLSVEAKESGKAPGELVMGLQS